MINETLLYSAIFSTVLGLGIFYVSCFLRNWYITTRGYTGRVDFDTNGNMIPSSLDFTQSDFLVHCTDLPMPTNTDSTVSDIREVSLG